MLGNHATVKNILTLIILHYTYTEKTNMLLLLRLANWIFVYMCTYMHTSITATGQTMVHATTVTLVTTPTMPSVFPNGIEAVVKKTGLPIEAHNRWWYVFLQKKSAHVQCTA